jgi:hypothetical protein
MHLLLKLFNTFQYANEKNFQTQFHARRGGLLKLDAILRSVHLQS